MPYCPECKYEYREGIIMCPDCSVKLVGSLSAENQPANETTNEYLVSVFSTDSQIEANLVKGMLEASGIEVYEQPGKTVYGFADTMIDFEIFVLKSEASQAVRLIKESQESENT